LGTEFHSDFFGRFSKFACDRNENLLRRTVALSMPESTTPTSDSITAGTGSRFKEALKLTEQTVSWSSLLKRSEFSIQLKIETTIKI
jgi:hypothetical protein